METLSTTEKVIDPTVFDSDSRVSYLMSLQKQVMALDFTADVIKAVVEHKEVKDNHILARPVYANVITDHTCGIGPDIWQSAVAPLTRTQVTGFSSPEFSKVLQNLSMICGIQKTTGPVGLLYKLRNIKEKKEYGTTHKHTIDTRALEVRANRFNGVSELIPTVISIIESHVTAEPMAHINGARRAVGDLSKRGLANCCLVNNEFLRTFDINLRPSIFIQEFRLESYPSIMFLYHPSVKRYATAFYHSHHSDYDRGPQLMIMDYVSKDTYIDPLYFEPKQSYILRYAVDVEDVSKYFVPFESAA